MSHIGQRSRGFLGKSLERLRKFKLMKELTPAKQWDGFFARFNPGIVTLVKGALVRLRKLVPGAMELVYDNFNALVIGFGPNERASRPCSPSRSMQIGRICSSSRAHGSRIRGLLKGGGFGGCGIRLSDPKLIDDPIVIGLMSGPSLKRRCRWTRRRSGGWSSGPSPPSSGREGPDHARRRSNWSKSVLASPPPTFPEDY